jgi:hypothetical protein
MAQLKLGKLPARKGAISLKFTDYIDLTKFPKVPDQFGHENLVKTVDWGMLGNDQAGNCVFAGAAHETMMWSLMGESNCANFSTKSVISDYSAVTGYNGNPSTDHGTDMQVAASYRKKTGILDADGNRHRVEAYLALPVGNLQIHLIALYLFGAVGIGILFPQSAMEQFNNGEVWDIVPNSPIDGGHYVPLVAKRDNIMCVTWGAKQGMTEEFFQRYNDESVVYLSPEMFVNRKSPEGFDYDQLLSDLQHLNPSSPVK